MRLRIVVLLGMLACARSVSADFVGEKAAGSVVSCDLDTQVGGVPTALSNGVVTVYKDDGTVHSTAGVTFTAGRDGNAGSNHLAVNTAADSSFYANDHYYAALLSGGTVAGASVVGVGVCSWRLVAGVWATASRTLTAFGFGSVVTVSSITTSRGDIDGLVPGDAYVSHPGPITFNAPVTNTMPDLTGATVRIVIEYGSVDVLNVAGSVLNPGGASQQVAFALTAAQTAQLTRIGNAAYTHEVEAVWAADSPPQPKTIISGAVNTRHKYTN